MKATKKHIRELEKIKYDLERGVNYLQGTRVKGIAQETSNPNGGSYTIVNPALAEENDHTVLHALHVDVVNHEYGSHIVGIYKALRDITNLIEKLEN